jgi:hypothetical protein
VLLISAAAIIKVIVFLISRSSRLTLESLRTLSLELIIALILAMLFSLIAVLLILAVSYNSSGVILVVIAEVSVTSIIGIVIRIKVYIEGYRVVYRGSY